MTLREQLCHGIQQRSHRQATADYMGKMGAEMSLNPLSTTLKMGWRMGWGRG